MAQSNEKIVLRQTEGTPEGSRLRGVFDRDPRLRALLEKLSPDDARVLGGILSDPEKVRSVLSSPQARAMMKKNGISDPTGNRRDS